LAKGKRQRGRLGNKAGLEKHGPHLGEKKSVKKQKKNQGRRGPDRGENRGKTTGSEVHEKVSKKRSVHAAMEKSIGRVPNKEEH